MSRPLLKIEGFKYGGWLVLKYSHTVATERHFMCRCSCGKEKTVGIVSLRNGKSKSCGCERDVYTHGFSRRGLKTPEYEAWVSMLSRCRNKKLVAYKNYGGRGIKVDKRFFKFENFIRYIGRKPGPEYSLDRINNEGNYTYGNIRWATRLQQNRNRRICYERRN